MSKVTISDLRKRSNEVINRALAGENIVITRSGIGVAKLVPLPPEPFDATQLLERWRSVPSYPSAASSPIAPR